MPTRRRLLAGVGALSAGAGCSGLNPLAEREPLPRLGPVRMVNFDDKLHKLSVKITRTDEMVLTETFRIGGENKDNPDQLAVIQCGVGDERGRYELTFETEAGNSAKTVVGRENGPTASIQATIHSNGDLTTLWESGRYRQMCDGPSPTSE